MVYNVNRNMLCSRWNGTKWLTSVVKEDAPYNNFDLAKVGHSHFRLFLGNGELQVFDTFDGGSTWKFRDDGRLFPADRRISKVMRIENASPQLEIVAFENDFCRRDPLFKGQCEQDYRGLYKVWTLGSADIPSTTRLHDDAKDFHIVLGGIGEMNDTELRLWEVTMEVWFNRFFRGRFDDGLFGIDDTQRDSRDITSEFKAVTQTVKANYKGQPVNKMLATIRVLFSEGRSYAGDSNSYLWNGHADGTTSEFSFGNFFTNQTHGPVNITGLTFEDIIALPFQDEVALADIVVQLQDRVSAWDGLESVELQNVKEAHSSPVGAWISFVFISSSLLFCVLYGRKSKILYRETKSAKCEGESGGDSVADRTSDVTVSDVSTGVRFGGDFDEAVW